MWILPTYLPHWMCFLVFILSPAMDYTWRSGFEQKRNSILLVHWSQRQRTSRSCNNWPQWTTSCTILAKCLEETSRRGILGWYWLCHYKGTNILSDSIECNHSSRNTSILLYSKSCQIEDCRSFEWRIILISSTTTKDHITSRSGLDQRESSTGFYSWSTSSR